MIVRRSFHFVALVVGLIAVVAGFIGAGPAAADAATSFGDGTYLVGRDIVPGRYVARAPEGCYWERLSGTGGSFDDIIANDFVSSPGQQVVTIYPSDVAFKSDDCGRWQLVATFAPAPQRPSTGSSGS